jgi:hypothetical protein
LTEPTYHLGSKAQAALALPEEQRIEYILKPRWIGYTHAKQIIAKLDDLLRHPKTHRMPNMLLVGDTNNGKTMLIRRFDRSHPPLENPDGGITIPVMVVQAPPIPDERRFYSSILEHLLEPHRPRDPAAQQQAQVVRTLRRVNLRMLLIDEIHHVLAGPTVKQRQFLNVLKYLGNELEIPLVAVGTKEAVRAIQTDPQLANRFQPVALPPWEMNRDFLMLLASLERMIPLRRPSNLIQPPLAQRLLALSEGTIGELVALVSAAAVYAVRTQRERVDEEALAALDWIPPSHRRRRAERLA